MAIIDRITLEQAIDRGNVWALMRNGRWWRVRRNGATQLWKTRPDEYSIPIKAGLRFYTRITHRDIVGAGNPQDRPDFVVTSHDPNT
jgi:hypothetical protein